MIRFAQGFDLVGTIQECRDEGWYSGGTHNIAVGSGKFGGNAYQTYEAQGGYWGGMGLSNRIMMGFWYLKQQSGPDATARQWIRAYNAASTQSVQIIGGAGANGRPRMMTQWQGSSYVDGTLFNIQDNQYHWICLDVNYAVSGWIRLYVDNFLDINYTGNTIASGTPEIGYFYLPGEFHGQYYDDFIVWDDVSSGIPGDLMATDFPLAPQRSSILRPSSDVTAQFTRSTGASNYLCVDEGAQNSDTDYVSSDGTIGLRDLYGVTDLPYTPSSIRCVRIKEYHRNAGGGAPYVKSLLKSGATESFGTAAPAGTGYTQTNRTLLVDPNTGSPWTAAAVNALQLGIQNGT